MSNNNVTVETTTSTVNLGATQAAPKAPKNATKQQAARCPSTSWSIWESPPSS